MSHVTAYGNNSIYLNRSKSQIHRKPKHIKHVGMSNVYNIPIFYQKRMNVQHCATICKHAYRLGNILKDIFFNTYIAN